MAQQDIRHAHDHGADCDCGCHDHDHGHDRAHAHHHGEHEHEHEHHHGLERTVDLPDAVVALEGHVHEQASTVSVTFDVKEGHTVAFSALIDAMGAIAERVEAAGGIVGHIKAYGKGESGFAHASVTAAGFEPTCDGDTASAFGPQSDLQLAVIVMLVDLDELIALVEGCL